MQVSGEFAMFRHAANAGALDLKVALEETLKCMRRAGADVIITYFAPEILTWMQEKRDHLNGATSGIMLRR